MNDLGVPIAEAGTNSALSVAPYDVAVDRNTNIYAIQFRDTDDDPAERVMRFPAYDGSTGVLTNAEWQISSADNNMAGASGIAVDPTGTYVAVAFGGIEESFFRVGGTVKILDATTGAEIPALSLPDNHEHTDVAWDNVGNLYVCDNYASFWRAYSPPGANQPTTVAPQTLEVVPPPLHPYLQAVDHLSGQFRFTLCGRTNIDYIIVASTNLLDSLQSWTPVLTNNGSTHIRMISVNAPPDRRFFSAYVTDTGSP